MLTSFDPELVFLATSRSPATSQHISKRLDGYHTIQFMEHGGVSLSYDGSHRLMEGAWFWPAYPGPWIDFHPAPGYQHWAHRHIGFQGPLVGAWQTRGLWPFEPQPAQDAAASARFFDEIIALANRNDALGRLRAVNLIEGLLLEMADRRTKLAETDAWLESVFEQIRRSDAFSPDYRKIARDAGMGLSTLRRRFQEKTGISLHRYVMQSRIAAARNLLSGTDLSLQEIAARLGYENVHFFSRQFRTASGVAPGRYRQARLD